MAVVTVAESITIQAPAESVYEYRLEFMNLPSYNPHVSNVRATGSGEYAFDLKLPGFEQPMETPLRIVASTKPREITIETGPGYLAREVCTFESDPAGTLVTFEQTLTFEGDIPQEALDTVGKQAAEQARLELTLMKKILEG